MSRTDTAVRVIRASPDRVFAALTDPTHLPAGFGIGLGDEGELPPDDARTYSSP
jgi:uncharacterized protein YndB with AHSA1/START domain